MIQTSFVCISVGVGKQVFLKVESIIVNATDEAKLVAATNVENRFPKDRRLGGDRYRVVAEILWEFKADRFGREDVYEWCIFAREAFTLGQISNALMKLKRAGVQCLGKPDQQGDYKVDRERLAEFLGRVPELTDR